MNAKWIWVLKKTSLESTSRFLARYWQIGSQFKPKILSTNLYIDTKFIGLALVGKDIVFRFIIEYSSLMIFGP